MNDEQPTLKVVDRRPFNPDGTPRELSPEEQEASDRSAADFSKAVAAEKCSATGAGKPSQPAETATPPQPRPKPTTLPRNRNESRRIPVTIRSMIRRVSLSLIMSLASNAASSLGMMPHPVTGETGVDLKTAKHWIDVLGMLEQKTRGNLDPQEEQVLESLLADLRMQYVSFTSSPPPPAKFSASDITGGK